MEPVPRVLSALSIKGEEALTAATLGLEDVAHWFSHRMDLCILIHCKHKCKYKFSRAVTFLFNLIGEISKIYIGYLLVLFIYSTIFYHSQAFWKAISRPLYCRQVSVMYSSLLTSLSCREECFLQLIKILGHDLCTL